MNPDNVTGDDINVDNNSDENEDVDIEQDHNQSERNCDTLKRKQVRRKRPREIEPTHQYELRSRSKRQCRRDP